MITLEFFIFESDLFSRSGKKLPPVLFSYRKDEFYDAWHVPGGFLGANEKITQAVRRILKRELGITPKAIQPILTLNRPNAARDNHVSIFFAVTTAKKIKSKEGEVQYFNTAKLPSKIIPYYRMVFSALEKIYVYSKTLPRDKQKRFWEMLKICEAPGE